MEEILSQEEIDAIFAGMKEGRADLPDAPAQSSTSGESQTTVLKYDFHKPDRISKEQIRSIRVIYDYFCRNLSTTLSAYLRTFVQVSLVSVDQIQYNEFLHYLPEVTSYHSVGVSPLNGYIALEIGPALAFPFVDILVGGSGDNSVPERELTDLEQDILESVIKLILKEMRESWKPIIDLDMKVDRRETKPQMLQLLSSTEIVVATGFEMKVGPSHSGMMNISMPSIMLKSLKSKFDQHWSFRKQPTSRTSVAKVVNLIRSSRVNLGAEIQGTKITLGELLSLNPGDVIKLDQPLLQPLILTVNQVAKYNVYVGAAQENRVAQIHSMLLPAGRLTQNA